MTDDVEKPGTVEWALKQCEAHGLPTYIMATDEDEDDRMCQVLTHLAPKVAAIVRNALTSDRLDREVELQATIRTLLATVELIAHDRERVRAELAEGCAELDAAKADAAALRASLREMLGLRGDGAYTAYGVAMRARVMTLAGVEPCRVCGDPSRGGLCAGCAADEPRGCGDA